MTRIACLNNISEKGLERLPKSYEITEDIDNSEGILVRSAAMHDMQFSDNLLAVARAGAGVNNIPLQKCADQGIVVFNTPGANANSVKELVLAGMFLASRDILGGADWCRENASDENISKAAEKAKKKFAGREIAGKKLGVIGLGAIGALVANAALDLGMEVYGYDPFVSVQSAWRLSREIRPITDLCSLCESCDYITIHVPALEATKNIIGKSEIDAMKSNTIFLNFSRNSLVDEEYLLEALYNEKIAKYVTDFANSTIMNAPEDRTIVLPHLGASTEEAEDSCAIMAVREMVDYLENGNIANSVNFPSVNLGERRVDGQRVAIAHKNEPGVINAITEDVAKQGHNLANIASKASGDYAYALIDIDGKLGDEALKRTQACGAVLRVRVL